MKHPNLLRSSHPPPNDRHQIQNSTEGTPQPNLIPSIHNVSRRRQLHESCLATILAAIRRKKARTDAFHRKETRLCGLSTFVSIFASEMAVEAYFQLLIGPWTISRHLGYICHRNH